MTNTLIERKGARTALITTEGFRDALEIGNEGRYDIYDLGLVKPPPLVERRFRFGVPERMTAEELRRGFRELASRLYTAEETARRRASHKDRLRAFVRASRAAPQAEDRAASKAVPR